MLINDQMTSSNREIDWRGQAGHGEGYWVDMVTSHTTKDLNGIETGKVLAAQGSMLSP